MISQIKEPSKNSTILVLGGAGYIGSHVNLALSEQGYDTVVLDNLVYGHREAVLSGTFVHGDLADLDMLDALFTQYHFDGVMHFAAYASVGESVRDPGKYYINNVANTIGLLEVLKRHRTKAIVFSSTCAVYGIPKTVPIPNDHPHAPISPYGRTKAMVEKILEDFSSAYGIRYAILRYFNAAGADPEVRIGEAHDPETHLIPLVLRAVLGKGPPVNIFGTDYDTPDGTCVRDYIHVCDLANAHILALQQILSGQQSVTYSLGNGTGTSVREIITATEEVTGRPVPVVFGPRRDGDPPVLIADPQRTMRDLGWKIQWTKIQDIIDTAWRWEQVRQSSGWPNARGGAREVVPGNQIC